MTVEPLVPAPPYVIAGVGPYPIPHPYQSQVELVVSARSGVVLVSMVRGADYTVSPTLAPDGTGAVTLSAGFAAAHAGGSLFIERATIAQQGWAGVAGAREKGLERQLDRIVQVLQDLWGRLLRTVTLPPGSTASRVMALPSPGRVIGWNGDGTQLVTYPREAGASVQSIESKAALAGLAVAPSVAYLHAAGRAAPGDGGEQMLARADGAGWGRVQSADGAWWRPTKGPLTVDALTGGASLTLRIPTDFPTLQAAVDATAHVAAGGRKVLLRIEAGHRLTAGLKCVYGDFSKYVIVADDPVVHLAPGFFGVSAIPFLTGSDFMNDPEHQEDPEDVVDPEDEMEHLIMGFYARMPILACVIDMGNLYDNGYYSVWGCDGFVFEGCGVIGAGHDGLNWRSGRCSAHASIWDRANNHAVRVSYTADVNVQQGKGRWCCQAPDAPGYAAMDVSRTATCHARLFDGRYAGRSPANNVTVVSPASGFNFRRTSAGTLQDANFSGASGYVDSGSAGGGALHHSSRVSMYGIKLDNIGVGYPLVVRSGALADIAGASLSGYSGSRAVYLDGGGIVTGHNVKGITGGPITRAEISGGMFNSWHSDGAFLSEDHPSLFAMGEFSSVGATDGKIFTTAAALYSSRDTTAAATHLVFHNPNGNVGRIATSDLTTSYSTTSDEGLKTFTGALSYDDAVEIIMADPVRRFTWTASDQPAVGWGAQTSYTVSSDLATPGGWIDPETGADVPEGTPEAVYQPWGVDQGKRTPYLWAAVAGLVEKVAALEAQLSQPEE